MYTGILGLDICWQKITGKAHLYGDRILEHPAGMSIEKNPGKK
jgi:hypothetical protein